jgi:hypothetical protein
MESVHPSPKECPACHSTMLASEADDPSPGYDTYMCRGCSAIVFAVRERINAKSIE